MEFDQGPKKNQPDATPENVIPTPQAGGPPIEHEALSDLVRYDLAQCEDATAEQKAAAPEIPEEERERLSVLRLRYQTWRAAYSEKLLMEWKSQQGLTE